MKLAWNAVTRRAVSLLAAAFIPAMAGAQSTLNCQLCHSAVKTAWLNGRHAQTQNDVAGELAANWIGQTPDSVINGSAAENCVACHSPIAVAILGGMTEVQVMDHFFSTTGGMYTDSTHAVDTANWPHVACTSCHNVPSNHPASLPTFAIFNSTTAKYDSVASVSALCGQCHGTLRFQDTDHRVFDAWKMSRHGHGGQADVAGELASSWAGKSPNDVINGPDAENCVACHAPTAILMNGGMTPVQVLTKFFTTSGGMFTDSTTTADSAEWPDVACITCHNPHTPEAISYFNTDSSSYQVMGSSGQLCGQCHGNLRFPGTDHLTYNIESGTGAIGVPDQVTMPGVQCVDCHMHRGTADGTNSLMYGGHRWSPFIVEPDSTTSASCTSCHAGMNADSAKAQVAKWKGEFAALDSVAHIRIASADSFMSGKTDSVKLFYLNEAHHNLAFAESDEGGGFHNHNYSMALLNDAVSKSEAIITGVRGVQAGIPRSYGLQQNYPNPFNPSTTIRYELPAESRVTVSVFNVLGQEVFRLVDEIQSPGYKSIVWNSGGRDGKILPTGIYFYRMKARSTADARRSFEQVRKMILIR